MSINQCARAFIALLLWCIGLTACAPLEASASVRPAIVASPEPSQTSTLKPTLVSADEVEAACVRDAQRPIIAPGWKLLWQQKFEQPIARPPMVDGPQMLLISRSYPDIHLPKDTVLAVNPQTSEVEWQLSDVSQPVAGLNMAVLGIQYSHKYWLLLVQYYDSTAHFELVIDRRSGTVIYDSGVLIDAPVSGTTISDDVLLGRYGYGYMRRIDLPAGTVRWTYPWKGESRGLSGVFVVNNWLYAFDYWGMVTRYDPENATGQESTSFGVVPLSHNDVYIHDGSAIVRSQESVIRFNLQTLSPMWTSAFSHSIGGDSNAFWGDPPSMTVSADSIYLFDAQGNLMKVDLVTGRTVWTVPAPGPEAMARPVVMQGRVYGFFSDGSVRAFSEADGRSAGIVMTIPLWYHRYDAPTQFRDLVGGLGVSGETLIVTTGCRTVYAIQRAP